MRIRDLINPYLVRWPMNDDLGPVDFQINRLVSQLDDMAIEYEGKWGVGQLEAWAYAHNSDLAEKFQRQLDKLADAMAKKDVEATQQLVIGFKRAYEALEANAREFGYTPTGDFLFHYTRGSVVYRVVRTMADARRAEKGKEVVVSCEELVNFYDSAHNIVYDKMYQRKQAKQPDTQGFDWERGSDLPPEF